MRPGTVWVTGREILGALVATVLVLLVGVLAAFAYLLATRAP